MDAIINQIKALSEGADKTTRRDILGSLRDLGYSIETSCDATRAISYLHFQPALIRIGIDLNVFNILSRSQESLTVSQLAAATGAAPALLGPILRYLASVGTIKQTSQDTFAANTITSYLSNPGIQSVIYYT